MLRKLLLFYLIFSCVINSQSLIPEWSKGIVWYQIFPERFANGSSSNDPTADKVFANSSFIPQDWKITKWTSNWFNRDDWEINLGGKFRDHLFERRYGGDIEGIISKLDYLKNLGVGAIYLNPIFEAVSLHKYDATCYHHIDINFGPNPKADLHIMKSENPENPSSWKWTNADKLFFKLIEEVHKREMKIIIDGVFNHAGTQFWAFQDLIKNQKNSLYKDWFIVKQFDNPETSESEFDYKGWWNIKSLPEFNRTSDDLNEGIKRYIFNSVKRWMDPNGDGDPSDGIDGWRLDVAREVPKGFWKQFSKLVKSINPQALLIGELWELSPDLISSGNLFDGLMNYNFAFAVNNFFLAQKNKISVSEFINQLSEIIKTYPEENLFVLQNLLSSHDTERLSSMINNPDRKYDSDADENNIYYNPGKPAKTIYEKQKLIAAFQFFFLGSPMIYYGDEVGMWGADDPHCRKPMIWSDMIYENEVIDSTSGFSNGLGTYQVNVNEDLFDFYKSLISVRNSNPELKTGSIKFIVADDAKRIFGFERQLENQKTIVVFNLGSSEEKIVLNTGFKKIKISELLKQDSEPRESIETLELTIEPSEMRAFKVISY